MSNQDIIATLHRADIRTLGDLDRWRALRRLSRWQALGVLVGVSAADRVMAKLAAKRIEMEGT